MRAHNEVLAFEEPPRQERQSSRTPIIDREFPIHTFDQVAEQGQERSLDGEGRSPQDAKEGIDRRQRTEERHQLTRRDDDRWVRGGGFVDEDDSVRVHQQPGARREAYQGEEDEEVVEEESPTADEAVDEAGEGYDDGEAEEEADGCMERRGARVSVGTRSE